jgi:hypothetical protein
MWLPKNESRTLLFYYQKTDAGSKAYSYHEPTEQISYLSNITKSDKYPQITPQIIEQITTRLGNLGLIQIHILPCSPIERLIILTPNGLQLGRKYSSWWLRSNLWYEEHLKNHWIWVIIGFLGGVISGLLIKWL